MTIKRLNDFPEGSGSLSSDDVFIFMDDPSGSGITKKISLSAISSAIGGGGSSDPKVIYYSGVFPSTIHNLDHQDADVIVFDLKDNTNIPTSSGYLSLTGMKAGKDGQTVRLINITDYKCSVLTSKKVYIFNSVLGSGSLPENRFDDMTLASNDRPSASVNNKGYILYGDFIGAINNGLGIDCMYSTPLQKWLITNNFARVLASISAGSVGGGGV